MDIHHECGDPLQVGAKAIIVNEPDEITWRGDQEYWDGVHPFNHRLYIQGLKPYNGRYHNEEPTAFEAAIRTAFPRMTEEEVLDHVTGKKPIKELQNGEVIVRDHFGNYYKGNATEMRHRGGDMPRIEAVICDDTHYSTLEGAVNGKGE